MADYRGSVGYLQLKADNAQRQQALADQKTIINDSGAEHDIGGKALGIVQGEVTNQRSQSAARAKAFADLTRALQVQELSNEGALDRQGVRRSENDPQTAARILRLQTQNEVDRGRLDETTWKRQFHQNVEFPDTQAYRREKLTQGDEQTAVAAGGKSNILGQPMFQVEEGSLPAGVHRAAGAPPGRIQATAEQVKKAQERTVQGAATARQLQRALAAVDQGADEDFGPLAGDHEFHVPVLGDFSVGGNKAADEWARTGMASPEKEAALARRDKIRKEVNPLIDQLVMQLAATTFTEKTKSQIRESLLGYKGETFRGSKKELRAALGDFHQRIMANQKVDADTAKTGTIADPTSESPQDAKFNQYLQQAQDEQGLEGDEAEEWALDRMHE